MMKIIMAIGVIMAVLLAGNSVRGDGCGIVNPSFEDDGRIDDITIQEPNGWSVDISSGKFTGFTYTVWPTDGFFNLSLYTNNVQFYADDKAMVSQQVDLAAVSKITFDVKLQTKTGTWDPSVCTAVVMVDDDVVWEPNSLETDVRGEYRNQVYVVEDKYRDDQPHTLSLGLRMNTDIRLWVKSVYQSEWDIVDCNVFCGGAGLIEGDIDRSCCVDANDLVLLASLWLSDEVEPGDSANLFSGDDELTSYATIDFRDFANYAVAWPGDMMGVEAIAANWLMPVDPDYEYNLFQGDDIRPHALINFFDVAILAETWLDCSVVEED